MGNLLFYKESFDWDNNLTVRTNWIENLAIVIDSCKAQRDNIYTSTDLFDSSLVWGSLLEFIRNTNYDFPTFRAQYPWMDTGVFQTLTSITWALHGQTPQGSNTLQDLDNEYPGANNSWIGLQEPICPEKIVYNYLTWHKFHSEYVSDFDYNRRCAEHQYFNDFFVPPDAIDLNQINKEISRGKYSKTRFLSLNPPKIKGEVIHMHFKIGKNCALNITGIWKHEVEGFELTTEECILLSEFGFKLPREYYK